MDVMEALHKDLKLKDEVYFLKKRIKTLESERKLLAGIIREKVNEWRSSP
jgi:hypothetical protein